MATRMTAAEIKAKYANRGAKGNSDDDDSHDRRSRNKGKKSNKKNGPSWNDDSDDDDNDDEDDRHRRSSNRNKSRNNRRRRDDEDEDSDEVEEDVEEAKPAKKVVKDSRPMTTGEKNKLMMSCFTLLTHSLICVLLSTAAALGIKSSYMTSTNTVLVGLYILLFSLILFVYEILQVAPKCCNNRLQSLDLLWKKNFGFLYGPLGRGAYVLFVGTLMFGISSELASNAGLVCIIWGFILIFLSYKYKHLFEEKQKFDPKA